MKKFLIEYIGYNDNMYRHFIEAVDFADAYSKILRCKEDPSKDIYKQILKIEDVSTNVVFGM